MDIEKYLNPLTDMYDRLAKWRQFRKDVDIKLRLFYLECRRNLELLNIVNLDPDDNNIPTDDADFFTIIKELETGILGIIFLEGDKNSKFYEILRKETIIEEFDEEKDKKADNQKRSLIQACVHLFVSINILKRICTLEKKGKALKKIYYRARLNNVKNNFINIVKSLSQHKEIREITGN